MKIAYLSTFYPFRGGIAQFNASLYRAFERENEIRAFTFTRQYPNMLFPGETQLVTEKDNVDRIPSIEILDSINPFTYYKTAQRILEFVPTIMINKFWMPFFSPSLGKVSKILKKNGVTNFSILDNVIPHERRFGDIALTKYFLHQQDAFVVMSETVKNDLLSLIPDAKYIYFPHPIYDHFGKLLEKKSAQEKLKIPAGKKVLLFFGFIRDYKGLDLLLKSLNLLPDDYHLIIAGEVYGNFEKYNNLIQDLNLENRITRAVKYISDSEVPLYFSAADVCVLPYKSATQSGIVGISYHFDLPIIATNVGSLNEMIDPYNTGMVINEISENAISEAISNYFDKRLYLDFIQNMNIYKENYSWDKLAKEIESFSGTL